MLSLVPRTPVPTCPKCASTQIERGPEFEAIVCDHAPSIPALVHSLAAVPPSIRCVNCNSGWDASEVDPTSERFAFLKAEYAKFAA
jgi:hypothetical protein